MTEFNAPPRHLAAPDPSVPVRDWWARDYDHVFVVFNPFFTVPGHHPASTVFGPLHLGDTAPEDMLQMAQEDLPDRMNEAPDDFPDTIKAEGKPIRWETIRQAIGGPDRADFERAAWLWTLEVDREDRDPDIVAALEEHCNDNGIYSPEEDVLPAALEPLLAHWLQALGIERVNLWNEWRSVRREIPVTDLLPPVPAQEIPGEKVAAVAAPGLILCWEFDDVAGLLAVTDDLYKRAQPQDFMECRPLDAGAYADVFNPKDAFDRLPEARSQ